MPNIDKQETQYVGDDKLRALRRAIDEAVDVLVTTYHLPTKEVRRADVVAYQAAVTAWGLAIHEATCRVCLSDEFRVDCVIRAAITESEATL